MFGLTWSTLRKAILGTQEPVFKIFSSIPPFSSTSIVKLYLQTLKKSLQMKKAKYIRIRID